MDLESSEKLAAYFHSILALKVGKSPDLFFISGHMLDSMYPAFFPKRKEGISWPLLNTFT